MATRSLALLERGLFFISSSVGRIILCLGSLRCAWLPLHIHTGNSGGHMQSLDSSLKIKDFREMTDEWLDFIINCRAGKTHDYDIVIGAMADDQIYNYVSDYMDGSITREQFWVLAKFKYPTHQINFCSKEALKCLEYRGFEVVK